MSRKPCCVGEGLKKGAWTTEEDKKLISYIHEHGEGGWRDIPQKAGLKRCGKSCRLRWANYLKPDIKRGEFSHDEEQIIIMLHASRGNKWSVIARHLPKRTDNEIKNYWNTHLKKRLIDQGIDPVTHKPLSSKNSDFQDDMMMSNHNQIQCLQNLFLYRRYISSSTDESPIKKRCFKRSSSTSKLLNKVATRAASMGKILSASMEGTLINSTPCLNDNFSETSHLQMDEFNPFSQSSEYILPNDQIGMNTDPYDFSSFVEQFSNNDGEETDKINGGYYQDLLMSDVSSTSVDEVDIMQNINGWSNYLVDQPDFDYDTNQDYDDTDFQMNGSVNCLLD